MVHKHRNPSQNEDSGKGTLIQGGLHFIYINLQPDYILCMVGCLEIYTDMIIGMVLNIVNVVLSNYML